MFEFLLAPRHLALFYEFGILRWALVTAALVAAPLAADAALDHNDFSAFSIEDPLIIEAT